MRERAGQRRSRSRPRNGRLLARRARPSPAGGTSSRCARGTRRESARGRGVLHEIVVAVGEAEPSLRQEDDVVGAVLVVLADVDAVERANAEGVEGGHGLDEVLSRPDGVDLLQRRQQRRDPLLLDRGGVHGHGPEISDLLIASAGGVAGSGLLTDPAELVVDLLAHLLSEPPGPFAGRNRMFPEPTPVCVLEEVGPGADGGVPVDQERIDGRRWVRGRRCGFCRQGHRRGAGKSGEQDPDRGGHIRTCAVEGSQATHLLVSPVLGMILRQDTFHTPAGPGMFRKG